MTHPPARPQWRRAVARVADPRITLASVAAMLLGACAAARDGPMHWGWLALTVAGIFLLEAAKNASGEVVDWDSGADRALTEAERTPFSGGKRVLVDGLLTRGQTAALAAVLYALAAAAGAWIVVAREPAVLALGLAGAAVAFFYHAPPFRLSYRGLGEPAVALAYGPGIACGTYLVQRGGVGGDVLLASLPLGLAIAAFLWANEFPDARADRTAGKRTWVVRLGPARAARGYAAIVAATYAGVFALPLAGLPPSVLLGFAGLPHAAAAARRLLAGAETPGRTVPAQAWSLLSFLLLAAGLGAGFLLAAGRGA